MWLSIKQNSTLWKIHQPVFQKIEKHPSISIFMEYQHTINTTLDDVVYTCIGLLTKPAGHFFCQFNYKLNLQKKFQKTKWNIIPVPLFHETGGWNGWSRVLTNLPGYRLLRRLQSWWSRSNCSLSLLPPNYGVQPRKIFSSFQVVITGCHRSLGRITFQ